MPQSSDAATSVTVPGFSSKATCIEAGEWSYNMDGPIQFSWYTRHLLSFSEEELYEFYLKLKNGEFYLPDPPQEEHPYKAVEMPILRRGFPTLQA